jgi:hypothetical protein
MMRLAILALATPLAAQWLHLPTPRIPRASDGKPDLKAAVSRTADGKPDFSGNWLRGDGQLGPAGGGTLAAPAPSFSAGPPVTTFRDVGANIKEGLPLQPWAAELVKARRAQNSKDNPDAHCLPIGIIELHTIPFYRKMIQVPGLLLIIHEYNASHRQIFTDGRPQPADPQPGWNGYSTAKWDGDTLVVKTTGFRDGIWLDGVGNPLTEAATVTERFHRVNYGRLEVEITVNDPKAYTTPWTVKVNQVIALNTDLLDYICLENEKDQIHLVGK